MGLPKWVSEVVELVKDIDLRRDYSYAHIDVNPTIFCADCGHGGYWEVNIYGASFGHEDIVKLVEIASKYKLEITVSSRGHITGSPYDTYCESKVEISLRDTLTVPQRDKADGLQ